MKSKKELSSNKINLGVKTEKSLSPSQAYYAKQLNRLQATKESLKKLKAQNHLMASIEKQQKKKKKKAKESKERRVKSYTKCECLEQLDALAHEKSADINDLLKEKENLLQTYQKLKYYTSNTVQSRQAYFIEQIQRRNLEIIYLEQKLQEKKARNDKELNKLKEKLPSNSAVKSPKKAKSRSKR